MQHITKLCADNLRTFAENHGVKLKASHAHELVAAYFGYKSRAALLADTKHPLSNLRQASIIILTPTESIDERRVKLHDLPLKLPDTYTLAEPIYAGLYAEKWILSNIWPSYETLAKFLADEYLRQNRIEKIYRNPTGEGVKIENVNDCIHLTVTRFYQIMSQDYLQYMTVHDAYITTTIKLQRIAAHIGYGNYEISVQIDQQNELNYQNVVHRF